MKMIYIITVGPIGNNYGIYKKNFVESCLSISLMYASLYYNF